MARIEHWILNNYKKLVLGQSIRQVWKIARWLTVVAVTILMGYALYRNRTDIKIAFDGPNWFWLLVALILNLIASLVYVGVWYYCARLLGSTKGYDAALMSLSVAGAARYIPGGIWPVAGLVFFGPAAGLPRRVMPVLAILAQGVHLLVACLFGVCGLLLLTNNGFMASASYFWGVALLGGLGLLALGFGPRYLTPLLIRLIELRLPIKATETIEAKVEDKATDSTSAVNPTRQNNFGDYKLRLPAGALLKPALPSAIFWLLNGLRLWVATLAFSSLNATWLPYLVWAGTLTTLVSAFFFFVPLGLGIVEGSLALLLGALLPWPVALGVVAANRLIRTANDFIFLGVGLWLYRRLKNNYN